MAKINVHDMVRGSNDSQFLGEKIEGIVVKITHLAGSNPITNQVRLCLVQDKNGAHYRYVDERWLKLSNTPRFEPKRLRKGCLVSLSPHSNKKSLCRKKRYSVKEVDDNMATLILGEGKTIKVHAEDLKIIR